MCRWVCREGAGDAEDLVLPGIDLSGEVKVALATGQGTIAVEDAIRAADPCLPCTAAPPGAMNLTIKEA